MQGFLILFAIIAIVVFLMPFILGTVIVFIAALALLLLLANFGLLPGVVLRRRGRVNNSAPRAGGQSKKIHFEKEEHGREENKGWGAASQDDVEVVTLPETALHKDEDSGT
ncbi:MAG: hypothetical protein LBK91_02385 [Synergistaceae bacterium]|jgi:membrane protein implicated in regulation of membrane protease activity|nr:hypothetical protein [Synergistaceae bacterium]